MFSLDTKQWESVATGLLSSVSKKDSHHSESQTKPDSDPADTPVEKVAVLAEER